MLSSYFIRHWIMVMLMVGLRWGHGSHFVNFAGFICLILGMLGFVLPAARIYS